MYDPDLDNVLLGYYIPDFIAAGNRNVVITGRSGRKLEEDSVG